MQTLHDQRVLVVEDDYAIALDLCETLSRNGARVVGPIASLEDALAQLDSLGRIDVAVLDINLNGEWVYPLAKELALRTIPFIFATGYDEMGILEQYRRVPTCNKPVRMETVVEIIRRQVN